MANPQEDDVGTIIRYHAQEDISNQTVLKLKYRKPDGSTGEWTATLYQTEYAQYITEMGDLVAGVTKIQLYIVTPAWTGHGEIKEFTVDENIP